MPKYTLEVDVEAISSSHAAMYLFNIINLHATRMKAEEMECWISNDERNRRHYYRAAFESADSIARSVRSVTK